MKLVLVHAIVADRQHSMAEVIAEATPCLDGLTLVPGPAHRAAPMKEAP